MRQICLAYQSRYTIRPTEMMSHNSFKTLSVSWYRSFFLCKLLIWRNKFGTNLFHDIWYRLCFNTGQSHDVIDKPRLTNSICSTFSMLVVPGLSWPILFGQNHLRQTKHFNHPSMHFAIKCDWWFQSISLFSKLTKPKFNPRVFWQCYYSMHPYFSTPSHPI